MKTLLIIIGIGLLGYGAWILIQTKPDPTIPEAVVTGSDTTNAIGTDLRQADISGRQVDNSKTSIVFTGFGPGKEHNGSFISIRSNLSIDPTKGVVGTVTVDVNSLSTDNEKLTAHLKTADFFDTAKYPTATLTMKSSTETIGTGTFMIHGVSKDITFPIKVMRNESGVSGFGTTFTLNLKEFGIDQAFANETVQLGVTVALQ